MYNKNSKRRGISMFQLKKLITAAVLIGITTVVTLLAINVPVISGAYIHIGDAIIFLSVYALGIKYAPFIGGLGGMFADMILGAPQYVIFTLPIKALMAIVCALIIGERRGDKTPGNIRFLTGMCAGGIVMVLGYIGAEWYLTGNLQTALASSIYNILQAAASVLIAYFTMPMLKNIIKRTLWD